MTKMSYLTLTITKRAMFWPSVPLSIRKKMGLWYATRVQELKMKREVF